MGKSIHLCEKISEHTSLLANHSALYLLMDCLSAYDLPGHSHDGARSLLDPRFEHESCGVGFVATLTNRASHSILQQALTALARLAHRGAIAADGRSSDGVGVMTGIPREFLLNEIGAHLDADKPLAVGVVFLPQDSEASVAKLEACLKDQGIRVLGWRAVPTRNDVLGRIALATLPVIRQVLLTAEEPGGLDRRLFLVRKQFERSKTDGYLCSLSASTMVYKGMCAGRLLAEFYPDLADERFTTPFALFHQRYATNVLPSWDRAQPLRVLAHNGEINTVWGNRARMDARAANIPAECYPIFSSDGSDSTTLDEVIELLARNGRTVAEAIRMLVPPAQGKAESNFLRYHGDATEPWDGPAALAFADSGVVGVALDRNGLRPCRYFVTDDGLVVAGSEAGLVDLDPERIVHSGRLGPGQMLAIDLELNKLYEDADVAAYFDASNEYRELVEDIQLEPSVDLAPPPSAAELTQLQRAFGYTKEDVRMILTPMAADGKDAVWSMGDDTPLAPLARSPRPVYAYFRQRFAQVTNPPIDPLRESCVLQMHTRLGPWAPFLDKHARIPGVSLNSPYLSLEQVHALRTRDFTLARELPLAVLDCVYAPSGTLVAALDDLCARAIDLVRGGAAVLLLSDRSVNAQALPVPMALATGAVHHVLVNEGIRTRVGLAVEAGDCRDLHHAALLLGMGAGAICPWLALETARSVDAEHGAENMLHALDLGLAKIMSKMGISVVDSYRGAHLFDCLGLGAEVIKKCFSGTYSPIGGIGFAELEATSRQLWVGAFDDSGFGEAPSDAPTNGSVKIETKDLPDYGWIRFRKSDHAEPHSWQPQTVRALQMVTGAARNSAASTLVPAQAWAAFSTQAVEKDATVLREMLEMRPAGAEVPFEEVEPESALFKRFVSSAMSLGSLSPEAHETITIAMNMMGARSNTGEGGEDPAAYAPVIGEDGISRPSLLNNKVKQVASARFGVTAEYLAHAEEIEIKIAQGAKPGEGGQLPAYKVTELIARLRHAQMGISLISPPPHHDIYSIEDLAQLIHDLKRVNPRAAIGVKLVSGCGVGTIASGVAKAYADYIVIAGHSGGTGASSLSSIKYAGNPWELGLAEAQQSLIANGLRGRVRLRCDGGLRTARDILVAAMLGADEFAFGTAVLVALGCDMARQCHLNTCPTGIATQREDLRAKFRGKPEHVVRMFEELAHDLQQLMGRMGIAKLEDVIGRSDLLEQVRFDGKLDLRPMLSAPVDGTRHWAGGRNPRPDPRMAIDDAWVEPAVAAAAAGLPYQIDAGVVNEDLTLGARLAGELAAQNITVSDDKPITMNLRGVAGQSFGAFAVPGMHLVLEGLANDFVGKGLCGGELILRGQGRAARDSEQHVILGNVALYGATSGSLFAAGRAGERFAVRNSGALAIVEGIGDHGCEYMTGGVVAVLGPTGWNFGAGMTGGHAWVFDEDGQFLNKRHYHADFLRPEPFSAVDTDGRASLRSLIELHVHKTASSRAQWMLSSWVNVASRFVRLTPKQN
jgi:glutamate synthase domain-containing protein 2/glutamate synthase domain-containing protein 1/glutamate synthase domain-containing protein 3